MRFDCGTISLEAEDAHGGGAFPVNCNCWPCEVCAPRKRWRLIKEIEAGRPNRFITLTVREGEFATAEIAAERLAWAWKIIVQRWRRLKPGNKCEFFVVREAQRNGQPHLHIAWHGGWIDWAWLKAQMLELLNSPHVDVRAIHNPQGAGSYIAKYLGKAPHRFGTMKRYWCSRGWRKVARLRQRSVFRFERRQWRVRLAAIAEVFADAQRRALRPQWLPHRGIGWGRFWREPPRSTSPPCRWRYQGGFLRQVCGGR